MTHPFFLSAVLFLATWSTLFSQDDLAPTSKEADPALQAALQLQELFARRAKNCFQSVVTVTSWELDPEQKSVLAAGSKPEQGEDEREGSWGKVAEEKDIPGYRKIAMGSGVVIDKEGHILTCRHLLLKKDGSPADIVSVETPDQRHTICVVLGAEPTLNLGILQLKIYSKKHPPMIVPAKIGNNAGCKAGHYALAFGDPFGPEQFFAYGNFTALPNRDCYQELLTSTYLQMALRVHPQCYGGPVMNIQGEVVGILMPRQFKPGVVELADNYGIEFALPINIAKGIYPAIIKKRSFRSPWIGYAVMSRPELLRERPEEYRTMKKPRFGIYIENVFSPSPAATLGVKPGDFLVKFDGQLVHTPLDFQKFLYLAGIGKTVELELARDAKPYTIKVKIEPRPSVATTR
jgi:serine protease Do